LIETITDELIDKMFGVESALTRREFVDLLITGENNWILFSDKIRKKAKICLKKDE
jgi:hypothetical protein